MNNDFLLPLETKIVFSLIYNKKCLEESPFMLRFKLTKIINKQRVISIDAQDIF
jgi:hypothetical protein